MRSPYFCGSAEHTLSRRQFLGGAAAGVGGALGFGSFIQPLAAQAGLGSEAGAGHLPGWAGPASWKRGTPSPGTNTGGPFQAIPTSVPGVHICELLPYTARQMHRMALVRGINTAKDDHGQGDVHHADRPPPRAGHDLSAPRLGLRQAARRRRPIRCPATSTSRRAAAAASDTARCRLPRPALCLVSRSATASRPPT